MTFQKGAKAGRVLALAALVLLPWRSNGAPPPDPSVSSFDVEVKLLPNIKTLDVKVASLFQSQVGQAELCNAAAILVAEQAAGNKGYWDTVTNLGKQTADAIRDVSTLFGHKTAAKVGRLAGDIIDAFNYDDPYAQLGKLLIDEGTAFVSDKFDAKEYNSTKEAAAETIRERLKKALFPDSPLKGVTFDTTVGNCTAHVTPQFETVGSRPGLRVMISGDCGCKKPLGVAAARFSQVAHEVANAGLGLYQINIFFPLRRLDSSTTFSGTAIDLTKLWSVAGKLKEAIENDKQKEARDAEEEIEKLVGKASSLKVHLVLTPVLGEPQLEVVHAECNNCNKPTPTPSTGPPPPPPPPTTDFRAIQQRCDPGGRIGEVIQEWGRDISRQTDPAVIADYTRRMNVEQDKICPCIRDFVAGRYPKTTRDTAVEMFERYCQRWRTPTAVPVGQVPCDFSLGGSAFASPGTEAYSQLVIHCPTDIQGAYSGPAGAPVSMVTLLGHKFKWPPNVTPATCGNYGACGSIGPFAQTPCPPCNWSFQGTTASLTLNPNLQKSGWQISVSPYYDKSDPGWNHSCDGMPITLELTLAAGGKVSVPITMPPHNSYGNCTYFGKFMLPPGPNGTPVGPQPPTPIVPLPQPQPQPQPHPQPQPQPLTSKACAEDQILYEQFAGRAKAHPDNPADRNQRDAYLKKLCDCVKSQREPMSDEMKKLCSPGPVRR